MSNQEDTDVLKAIKVLLLALANQEKNVQKVLVDVQAVVAVTEAQNPAYQRERDRLRAELKSREPSEIESALTQLSEQLGHRFP